jgi:Transposase and inactivated derivatives
VGDDDEPAGGGVPFLVVAEVLVGSVQARYKFLTWYADAEIPEVRTLFIDTGYSNAQSEGINRVIKLVARAAFGFRNATNQRLRTRCVTTRRARGHLHTVQL